ncbi:MAG: alpha/beta hydrolase [Bdellovibrionales bacterium]
MFQNFQLVLLSTVFVFISMQVHADQCELTHSEFSNLAMSSSLEALRNDDLITSRLGNNYLKPILISARQSNQECNDWLEPILGDLILDVPQSIPEDSQFLNVVFKSGQTFYFVYTLVNSDGAVLWQTSGNLTEEEIQQKDSAILMDNTTFIHTTDESELFTHQLVEPTPSSRQDPTAESEPLDVRRTNGQSRYDLVKVHYATNRVREFTIPFFSDPTYYNGKDDHQLNYGHAVVSIPQNHIPGRVERPSYWRFEVRSDPEKHVTIHNVKTMNENRFFSELQNSVNAGLSTREALIYIHGFNVTFNDSIMNAAVLGHDMRFKGSVISFSWPSDGELSQYVSDRTDSERTVPLLAEFLKKVKNSGLYDSINIIAHSMGNDLLSRTIEQWHFRENQSRAEKSFKNVILTAPDVDLITFKDRYAPIFPVHSKKVSLYGSNKDLALIAASDHLNGAPRLGSMSPVAVFDEIDTIDASSTGGSFFNFSINHSYYLYADFIKDLSQLIFEEKPPSQRGLQLMYNNEEKPYWVL